MERGYILGAYFLFDLHMLYVEIIKFQSSDKLYLTFSFFAIAY